MNTSGVFDLKEIKPGLIPGFIYFFLANVPLNVNIQ